MTSTQNFKYVFKYLLIKILRKYMVNKISVIAVLVISLLVTITVADKLKLFDLLPRDHTEISCTNPLQIGLKAFTEFKGAKGDPVKFKVYDANTNTLLWTSPTFNLTHPYIDTLLSTTITSPPSLIRVDMVDASGNILSTILLEPDCDELVKNVTILYPPPNGCKLIINPDGGGGGSGSGSGGGNTSRGWPTVALVVPQQEIGKNINVIVKRTDPPFTVLAQSDTMTIPIEIISLNLVSVNPIPVQSFFDVTFDIKIDNITRTKAACTVINGAALESLLNVTTTTSTTVPASTTTTTTLPQCTTSADCNDNNQCTTDECTAGACVNIPKPNGSACDDGLFCTVSDVCTSGICGSSTPRNCNDSNSCTQDSCDEVSDSCTNTAVNLGTQTCGTGACQRTVPICAFGSPVTCTPGDPSPETCDNLDNDCDGAVDEGLGASACYTGPGGTEGVGQCSAGTQTCTNGAWGICTGEVLPTAETCNGLDDDCDGITDEGC